MRRKWHGRVLGGCFRVITLKSFIAPMKRAPAPSCPADVSITPPCPIASLDGDALSGIASFLHGNEVRAVVARDRGPPRLRWDCEGGTPFVPYLRV